MLLHRLALALHKTVSELETTMSMRELLDWQKFEGWHEPLPDRLLDIHFSMLAAIVCNLARAADSVPLQAAEFFVIRDRRPTPPPAESEIDRLRKQWRGE